MANVPKWQMFPGVFVKATYGASGEKASGDKAPVAAPRSSAIWQGTGARLSSLLSSPTITVLQSMIPQRQSMIRMDPQLQSMIRIAPRLASADAASFMAAGILLYRYSVEYKKLELLMGTVRSDENKGRLSILGGKKQGSEAPVDTAIREFDEETGQVISLSALKSLSSTIANSDGSSDSILTCYYPAGKYVLYLVNVDAVPALRGATSDVTKAFDKFIEWPRLRNKKKATSEFLEMSSLDWVDLNTVLAERGLNEFAALIFKCPALCEQFSNIKSTVHQATIGALMATLPASAAEAKTKAVAAHKEIARKLRDPKISQPLPPVSAANVPPPSDITVLDPSDAEYRVAAAFAQHAVVNVKKVNVAVRNQRFDAYVRSLPPGHQQTVRAFHGTPKSDNASSISRITLGTMTQG